MSDDTASSDREQFDWEVGEWFQNRSQADYEWDYWEVVKRFVCPDEGGRAYYEIENRHPYGAFLRKKTVPDVHLESLHEVDESDVERAAREVEA